MRQFFFGSCAVKPPPTPPPLPHVPSSIIVSNTTIIPIEIDQIDQVDILLPMNLDNTLPALLPLYLLWRLNCLRYCYPHLQ